MRLFSQLTSKDLLNALLRQLYVQRAYKIILQRFNILFAHLDISYDISLMGDISENAAVRSHIQQKLLITRVLHR